MVLRIAGALVGVAATAVVTLLLVLAFPQPLFAYHAELRRLSLRSDRPFDSAHGRAVLADVESRLDTSPLNDGRHHTIYVANAPWRETLVFNLAGGAAGVNDYPLTQNVFIRHSDIDANTVFGASGKPAAPPRTLAYYAAHEVAHSFTAERLGAAHLWNRGLPRWVREGYADYVGMGGRVDVDDLYRRWRAGDPALDVARSGQYARYRMLVAFLLDDEHWTVDQLLASRLPQDKAEAMLTTAMKAR
jgi:hypothetical protein